MQHFVPRDAFVLKIQTKTVMSAENFVDFGETGSGTTGARRCG